MFNSALKIWSYSPNRELTNIGGQYASIGLETDHVVNFEFRPESVTLTFIKVDTDAPTVLKKFTLANIPLVLTAIAAGKISDDFAHRFLLDFLIKQVMSGDKDTGNTFSAEFRKIWPEFVAYHEAEFAQIQAVASAKQQKADS